MNRRWNGSYRSANTPSWNKPGILKQDYNTYRCMVIKVLFADDPQNISKNSPNPEVMYNVVILGGQFEGNLLSSCRMSLALGSGNSQFYERTLKASSKDPSKVKLSQHDGDIVFVQFIQGHDAYPIITGLGKGISDKTSGTKKADGPREVQQYNGIHQEINNKGEYIFTQKGGTKDEVGGWTPGSSAIYTETISKDESVTRKFKSGLTIVEDGKNDKITITTSGGGIVNVDGKSKNISIKVGTTEIVIDGNSGKISLKGDMIDLGASTSDFVTKFTELASAFASHMHPYTDDGAPSMTGPPTAPLTSSVGSLTVKVQS